MSGRSSAYGDTAAEGHPAGPGSVSSSTGAISTTTAQQEGEGSEGEGETEGDIHTSNRSDKATKNNGYLPVQIRHLCHPSRGKKSLVFRI